MASISVGSVQTRIRSRMGLPRRGGRPLLVSQRGAHFRVVMQPLTDPPFRPAESAVYMRDEDFVVGAIFNGEARAYPWWILTKHHVVNDVVGGRPVAIIICEACSSAVCFDPIVDGRRLTFEITHLFNGTNCARDHQTRSLWAPIWGRAIRGRLKGTQLSLLPLVNTVGWGVWRTAHPDSGVLAAHLGSRTGHGSGFIPGHPGKPGISPSMKETLARWDTRFPHNALVLGVKTGGAVRAYPLELLAERGGVVNDLIDGTAVVVFSHNDGGSAAALSFSSVSEGRELTFSPTDRGPVDDQTNSLWTMEGTAIDGPSAGSQLTFIPSHVAEWHVFAAHYPDIHLVR